MQLEAVVYFDLESEEGPWVRNGISDQNLVLEGVMCRFLACDDDFLNGGRPCIDVLDQVDSAGAHFPILAEEGQLGDVRQKRLRASVVPKTTHH